MSKYIITTYENGKLQDNLLAQPTLEEAERMAQNYISTLYERYSESDMSRFEIHISEVTDQSKIIPVKTITLK